MRGVLAVLATLVLGFGYGTASAQATRTWVSGVGDDVNPCSRTAPCKTFAGAISKTATGGEINCLDSGGFGGVTITKSITLSCQGVTGGILVTGTNGITVHLISGGFVQLKGLDIDGAAGSGATGVAGISMVGNGVLLIEDCTIYGFQAGGSGIGVNVAGTSGAKVLIENTRISDNLIGVMVEPQGGVPNSVVIERTLMFANTNEDLSVTTGATAVITQATFAGGPTSIANTGGSVISYGNNVIRSTGAPTSTLPLQ